jgi:hypothetical protein
MKLLVFVLVVYMGMMSMMSVVASTDMCDLKVKINSVLSEFKAETSRKLIQSLLVSLQNTLAAESQSLLEKETQLKWDVLKTLDSDETERENMRELAKLLNNNDAKGEGFLYNLCGLKPKVSQLLAKFKTNNQDLIKSLFKGLRERVSAELPAIYQIVKSMNLNVIEELIKSEPQSFKAFSKLFESAKQTF